MTQLRDRNWTMRPGTLSKTDKTAIRALAEINKEAAQVLLTGEISQRRLSNDALNAIAYTNSMVHWPMFNYTTQLTIRMGVFDAAVVWQLVGHDLITGLALEEAKRFGFSNIKLSYWDFYQSLFETIGLWDTYVPMGGMANDNHRMYLNALTLLRKPMLNGSPASLFFSASPDLISGRVAAPNNVLAERDAVLDNSFHAPTSDEVRFLKGL